MQTSALAPLGRLIPISWSLCDSSLDVACETLVVLILLALAHEILCSTNRK